MSALPRHVLDIAGHLLVEQREPAYILLDNDPDGAVLDAGGPLEVYGLAGIERGRLIADQLDLLHALLPLADEPMVLNNMRFGDGQPADLYLHANENGCWVLLLDSSETEALRGQLQQKANDLLLLRDAQAKLLVQLDEANTALKAFAAELEDRVRARTAELAAANVSLRKEIAERIQAEEELRRSEEQLRHAQKMEAIGKLAGGVAHDFNNLMTVVLGYSELMSLALPDEDPMRDELAEVSRAGERAAGLARQLLAFSSRQVIYPRALNINDAAANMEKMLRRLIGNDIKLAANYAPDLAKIKADPGQIEQVIMNLVVNARDAMPDGGQVTVRTSNASINAPTPQMVIPAGPGPYVCLSVLDTGTGMPPEVIARIFEPFFTTKAPGKGTGLGLSVVYGIVRQHQGALELYSEIDRGTEFRIYFPVLTTAETAAAEQARDPAVIRGTGERILVIDDQEPVRRLAKTGLKQNGYEVVEAGTGKAAREVFTANAGQFAAIVTDIVLPDIGGILLAQELQAANPKLKVVLASGYFGERARWEDVQKLGYQFLPKPFTMSALLQALHQAIHQT